MLCQSTLHATHLYINLTNPNTNYIINFTLYALNPSLSLSFQTHILYLPKRQNMFHNQTPSSTHQDQDDDSDEDHESIREIHVLNSPHPPTPPPERHRRLSSSISVASTDSENFTTMSREFSALVLAGTRIIGRETSDEVTNTMNPSTNNNNNHSSSGNLERIGEEVGTMESNPLAIVPDNNPIVSTPRFVTTDGTIESVKKEETESKISAWQNAKISKINNRFKRDDAIINGWENEQVQKSSSWMKKIERKLEAEHAHAMEKMQNDIAKARRKAEERRATCEAKRGTKVARVMEVANLMRAMGRAPCKRSFF
ncbi:remorin 4.2-like [Bidens hawaiensis]|uniref:remorin 4.2-like n=1 Tax=Bidens hawaiensis TaxID=980011 RepID=UPI00404A04E3